MDKKEGKKSVVQSSFISIAFVMVMLGIFRVDYGDYYEGENI